MRRKLAPILEYPGVGPALIEPTRLYSKSPRIPTRCVLCFFHDVLEEYRRRGDLLPLTRLTGEGEPIVVSVAQQEGEPVAVAFPGIGAPFAAATLEELIALGARKFICVGGAGVLDGEIPVGQLMIPTRALRDEGTSYHYQKKGRFSRPDSKAVRALREACRGAARQVISVTTWTTDGVFRETPSAIRARRQEGCLAVEMEAAAFFAVARFRKVALAQLLYAGDDLSGESWQHRQWLQQVETRRSIFLLALDAVRRIND